MTETGLLGTPSLSESRGFHQLTTFEVQQIESSRIGGSHPLILKNNSAPLNSPQLTQAVLLPGRGMNTFQLKGFLPGLGEFDLLETLPFPEAEIFLNEDPADGNRAFMKGGAYLIPFANRIRGTQGKDGKTIEVSDGLGNTIPLPANWSGKAKGAERHAIHGRISRSHFKISKTWENAIEAGVEAKFQAGDFHCGWPSKTEITMAQMLQHSRFIVSIESRNVGERTTSVGVGWHPYFRIPSHQRAQAVLQIPASHRALTNNLDDVFPTGGTVENNGPYAVQAPQGVELGNTYFDDAFLDAEQDSEGNIFVTLKDPASNYGLEIKSSNPISHFQVYAPVDQSFVAIEPQTNLPDPFSPVWSDRVNRGMIHLKPGESFKYQVELRIFALK